MLSQIADNLKFLTGGLCTGYNCANNIYRVLWVLIDTFRLVGKKSSQNSHGYTIAHRLYTEKTIW